MLNIYDSIIIPITSYSTYTVLLASPDDRPESRNPDRGGSKKCGLWQNCSKRPSWSQNASQETHALNKLLGSSDLTCTKVDNPSIFSPISAPFMTGLLLENQHHIIVVYCGVCIFWLYTKIHLIRSHFFCFMQFVFSPSPSLYIYIYMHIYIYICTSANTCTTFYSSTAKGLGHPTWSQRRCTNRTSPEDWDHFQSFKHLQLTLTPPPSRKDELHSTAILWS